MRIQKTIVFGASALWALASFGAVTQQDIEGTWACDPYTMTGQNMTVTVTEQRTYGAAGSYFESETSLVKVNNGITVTTESNARGSWSLVKDTITLRFASVKFLSSSNSNYTVAMGQLALDEQHRKKDWSTSKVLEFRQRLVTTPIQPMYKEAQVVVSCTRI